MKWQRYRNADVIPMWVADMDFAAPPAIRKALSERIDHGVFGYPVPTEQLVEAVINWLQKRYSWQVDPSWLVWLPGLVPALNVICRTIGEMADEVITFTPIYPPFLKAPQFSNRQLKALELARVNGRYSFDIDKLEDNITPKTRLLLLCNPHNPVARAYTADELQRVAQLCLRRNIVICADEVHADLILDDKRHIPVATLGSHIADNTVTLMSPSKAFNIPGLYCAFAVISNNELRRRFRKARAGIVPDVNVLGYVACQAALTRCDQWHRALLDYLRGSRDILEHFINDRITSLSVDHIEATYLAWIDARRLNLPDPAAFFEKAGVGLSDGRDFGEEGFVRLNFGCPRAVLLEALNRIEAAVTKHPGL